MEVLLSEWLPDCLVDIIVSYVEFRGKCIRSTNAVKNIWTIQPLGNGQLLCETFYNHLSMWDPKTETSISLTSTADSTVTLQNNNIWITEDDRLKRFNITKTQYDLEIKMEEVDYSIIVLDDHRLLVCFTEFYAMIVCNDDTYTMSQLEIKMPTYGKWIGLGGSLVAHTPNSCRVAVWHIETCHMVREWKAHDANISRMSNIAPTTLITCDYVSTIKVWNVHTGDCMMTLQHDKHILDIVGFHHYIYTRSMDCMIRVWDIQTRQCQLLEDSNCKNFFVNDSHLVTYTRNTIRFWV